MAHLTPTQWKPTFASHLELLLWRAHVKRAPHLATFAGETKYTNILMSRCETSLTLNTGLKNKGLGNRDISMVTGVISPSIFRLKLD